MMVQDLGVDDGLLLGVSLELSLHPRPIAFSTACGLSNQMLCPYKCHPFHSNTNDHNVS